LLILFCFFWPFLALAFLRNRDRSPMPFLAMLLPVALAMSVTWIGIADVIEHMAISGGGTASTAAGIAEALVGIVVPAVFCAAFVAIAALLRGHRPVADHFTIVMALAVAAEIVSALLFIAFIEPAERQIVLALIWAATAFVIALTISVRMAWYHRSRSNESHPVPAGSIAP
jgi:FlaA1/EpsC-like NDP-sugar epimerase